MFSPQVVISTPALELVMFGRLGNTMDNRIYVRKGIKSLKEVKRIAISRYGSNADFAARYLLQREGLRPDTDVALLSSATNRIASPRWKPITPTPRCSPADDAASAQIGHDAFDRRLEAEYSLLQPDVRGAPSPTWRRCGRNWSTSPRR